MMYGYGTGMMGGAMHGGMYGMMMFASLLHIALLGLTVYFVVRLLMRKNKVVDHPLMVLKERFAKGEIDEEEFKAKSKLLKEM